MTGFGSGKILTLGLGIRKINIHDRALKAEQLVKKFRIYQPVARYLVRTDNTHKNHPGSMFCGTGSELNVNRPDIIVKHACRIFRKDHR
jgi:hypothetical protein